LNSYIDNSSVRFEKAGINVEYSCPSGEVQTFLSESALLTICNNVFDNIIKFAPEGTKVFVMVSATEEDSLVIFKNSGRGIPESENGRIFDLNYKGANASYGNGLGLSQVREIIEDFGGGVWGKSTYDTGFALYLQIPKHQIQKEQKGADYE
jgi:signal transduction histidine kinase